MRNTGTRTTTGRQNGSSGISRRVCTKTQSSRGPCSRPSSGRQVLGNDRRNHTGSQRRIVGLATKRRVSTPRRASFGEARLEGDDGHIACNGSGLRVEGEVIDLEVAVIGRVLVAAIGIEGDQDKLPADGFPLRLSDLVDRFGAEDTSDSSSGAIIDVGDVAGVIQDNDRGSVGGVEPSELVSLCRI